MAFANNGGVRLYWRLDGAAGRPALLLINALGTDVSMWDSTVPYLLPQFRVLRMDTRGHGASDAPAGDYRLQDLAGDALAVMDAAGVERAAVCGLSMGGMIAMTLALRADTRLPALVLACTSAQMDAEVWSTRIRTVRAQGMTSVTDAVIERFFTAGFRCAYPELTETVRQGLLTMSADGYAGGGSAIRDMDLIGRIGAIRTPTLVLTGRHDVSTPFEGHGEPILAAIDGARHVALDTAHLANVEAPTAFAAAVRSFVGEVLDGTAVREAGEVLFDAGTRVRRQVLGDAWVDRSLVSRTEFNADFLAMITRYAWNEIWGRPGLDQRTRRLLVLSMTVALGRWEEFRLHVRSGLQQGGFNQDELKEVLMQSAIYAGVPAANTAFNEATAVIRELEPPAQG